MNHDLAALDGTKLGNYLLIRELGRGGNGVVYLAQQQVLERAVACKILFPELAVKQQYTDKFLQEARHSARLSHPNIVQALDAGVDSGLYFFVMEYVNGTSLEHWRLHSPEKLTPRFLLDMAVQLAQAMEYAWEFHHITHGDIKPDNLLITNETPHRLKLADLGLARVNCYGDDDEIMATPVYVAPEVITQSIKNPDPRSDIYSFGVMFYELSCGKAPFAGNMEEILAKHVKEIPEELIRQNPDMDVELAGFIDRMLAKNIAARPASWSEVKNTLLRIKNRLYPRRTAVPKEDNRVWQDEFNKASRQNPVGKRWQIICIILTLILLLAAAALLLMR